LDGSLKPAKESLFLNPTGQCLLCLLESAVTGGCGGPRYQQVKKGKSRQIPGQQVHGDTLKEKGRNMLAGILSAAAGAGGG